MLRITARRPRTAGSRCSLLADHPDEYPYLSRARVPSRLSVQLAEPCCTENCSAGHLVSSPLYLEHITLFVCQDRRLICIWPPQEADELRLDTELCKRNPQQYVPYRVERFREVHRRDPHFDTPISVPAICTLLDDPKFGLSHKTLPGRLAVRGQALRKVCCAEVLKTICTMHVRERIGR